MRFDLFGGFSTLSASLPKNQSREYIPGGTPGTAATIGRMRDMVSHGKRDNRIRKLAGEIIAPCAPKDYQCYARAIWEFCTHKIKYAFDPVGVEYVESPWRIVENGIADCDSIVVLFASLCENIGLPVKFVTIKTDPNQPGEFTHVYCRVKVPRVGWIPADPTMPDKPFGWGPPRNYPEKEWPASNDSPSEEFDEDMRGMPLPSVPQGTAFEYGSPTPGVIATVGVKVDKPYEFQDEQALITTCPEELELAPLGKSLPGASIASQPQVDFWSPQQIEELFGDTGDMLQGMGSMDAENQAAEEGRMTIQMKSAPAPLAQAPLPKIGGKSIEKKWLVIGALALGAYFLWGRK